MTDDLDTTLRQFLREQTSPNGWRARVEGKIDALLEKLTAHIIHDETRFGALDAKLGISVRRIDTLEESDEITGVHNLEQLRATAREHREEAAKWKWWVLGIVGTITTSGAAGSFVYWLSRR